MIGFEHFLWDSLQRTTNPFKIQIYVTQFQLQFQYVIAERLTIVRDKRTEKIH